MNNDPTGPAPTDPSDPRLQLCPEHVLPAENCVSLHRRRNVTEELIISLEPPERSWDELAAAGLKIANREMRLCELASDSAQKGFKPLNDSTWERFREAMALIKQNRVEERQGAGNQSTEQPSAADLMKRGHRVGE